MINYYTDSAKKSLWVLTFDNLDKFYELEGKETLTCFAASPDSGYHIGQQVHNPKLQNSNWQPLEGELKLSKILC